MFLASIMRAHNSGRRLSKSIIGLPRARLISRHFMVVVLGTVMILQFGEPLLCYGDAKKTKMRILAKSMLFSLIHFNLSYVQVLCSNL